jgi:hypothetical protein
MVNDDTERLPREIRRIIVDPGKAETDARIESLEPAVAQIRGAIVRMADGISAHVEGPSKPREG